MCVRAAYEIVQSCEYVNEKERKKLRERSIEGQLASVIGLGIQKGWEMK